MTTLMNQARNARVPKFAEEAVERARLAVVPRQRRRQAPRVPFVILVGLVLLGGVAGLLLFNTHMQKNSFTATALEQQAEMLHTQEQQLRLELDELRDPQALAVKARAMGMVPPDSPAFLDLATGRIIGLAAPSTGANDFRFAAPDATKPTSLDPAPIVLPRKVVEADPSGRGAANQVSDGRTGTKKNRNRND
jgi:type II secretory pathway pseudopilin PulG